MVHAAFLPSTGTPGTHSSTETGATGSPNDVELPKILGPSELRADADDTVSQALLRFTEYLREQDLRCTRQRTRIVEAFFADHGHVSAEELYEQLRHASPRVGQATVYRTLKHLCAARLARELHLDDGIVRYEHRHGEEHHDHLICEICQCQIEVVDEEIERLQMELTRRHQFIPTRHRLNLYGICPDCQKADAQSELR